MIISFVQVGGDHGGGSFKFWVTPLTTNPDKYTICVLMFKADETRFNLESSLQYISNELQNLQQETWR